MAATTRWKDTVAKHFDNTVDSLIDTVLSDEKITNITWENWFLSRYFEENQQIRLGGHDIEYNYVTYAYDQTSSSEISQDDRTIRKEGFIIPYMSEGTINYIVDQNTSAMKLLRKLLSYTGRNEIEKNTFEFTDDFFMWLIYRVYNAKYNVESVPQGKELSIDSIKGFRGDTEDALTQVSATGESVMNIISTLSFILESSNLNQIKLHVGYTENANVSLKLQRGTVNIYFEEYQGQYELEELEQRIAKLYLTVYLEILPYLVQEYNTDIGNEAWGHAVKIKFMRDVADSLSMKVKNRIAALDGENSGKSN